MSTNLRRLGKYELRELLGRGGMAEVWKAFDSQLQRFVAIKLLRADLQTDPQFVSRFEREAQVVASLHHPNIVQIYDYSVDRSSEVESTSYMVMHYVEGPTLAQFIQQTSRAGKFPSPVTLVDLFTPISLAVDYAHQKGMVHRDIKPSNILLDQHNTSHLPMGEPILSDFGLVKMLGGTTGTLSHWWVGTPHYTAPEQVMGAPGNERSDIYALGIMLYELCTGVLPFPGGSPTEIMMQQIHAAPPAPVLINPAIPPALTGVILRALAKEPTLRFPTASAMAAALAEAFNMPIPKALGGSGGLPEHERWSPTQLSSLSPHLLPPLRPSSTSSPAVSPANPVSSPLISGPPPPVEAMSGPSGSGNAHNTPHVPAISPSGERLPVITSLQPAAGTARPVPPAPPPQKPRRWLFMGLLAALIVVLLGSGLGAFLLFSQSRNSAPHQALVGHAFFISSGQIAETSNQGITDELEITLSNIAAPGPGKSYYGWLEPDLIQTVPRAPVLLGTLPVTNGKITYLYRGDAHHTNLLAMMSRFLITEEDAAVQPAIPSPDKSTWRYAAQFPQLTDPMDRPQSTPTSSMNVPQQMSSPQATPSGMGGMQNLTLLAHLRHLLAQAPELQAAGLPGGLEIWLFRNTEKVLEWSVSARDDWQTQSFPLLHRHVVRILDYLDGLDAMQQDAPGEPVLVTPAHAKMALLDVDPHLMNRSFLSTIALHLNALIQSPGSTPQQRAFAIKIETAIKNVQTWLANVRKDAQQLERMSSAQLAQPATRDDLLDPMSNDALSAFAGRIDPDTGNVQDGVTQTHYDIQHLATFDVQPSTS